MFTSRQSTKMCWQPATICSPQVPTVPGAGWLKVNFVKSPLGFQLPSRRAMAILRACSAAALMDAPTVRTR
jgi:hypothetical protein